MSSSELSQNLPPSDTQLTTRDLIQQLLTDAVNDPHKLRLLLQDLSLDDATFYGRYGCTHAAFLETAEDVLANEESGSRDPTLSILLMYGRSIDYSSRYARGGEEPTAAELEYLQRILTDAADVAEILNSIYNFGALAPGHTAVSHDSLDLDWKSLDLHRLGTTCLIFSIRTYGVQSRKLALKLNHVLFTTVGPIASSTSTYFAQWNAVSRACPFTPRVIASGVGWILEEFIEGPTLREFVHANVQNMDSLSLTLSVFPPILEALNSFHSANRRRGHGDINPANIIIQRRSAAPPIINARDSRYEHVAYLIDMGRNLLASDTIGRVQSADTAFVAPEVRQLPPDKGTVDRSADFFSLGHILAFCLGYERADGFYYLDERLFRDQPVLARLACGLINNSAAARVQYVKSLAKGGNGSGSDELRILEQYSSGLMEMLKEISDRSLTRPHSGLRVLAQGLFGTWHAVGIAIGQLVRTVRRRNTLSLFEITGPARIVVSAFAYVFGAAIMGYAALLLAHRDLLGIGHLFYALGFQPHRRLFNIELLMVGASFLIASFQYNVVVYGGVSFFRTSAPGSVRLFSEISLWLVTLIVLPCVFTALFVNPELWILVSACGQTAANINNIFALLARKSIDRRLREQASDLGWYEASVIVRQRFDILRYWTPTYIAYTSFLFVLATLAWVGALHDFMIFAVAVTFLNLFVLSYSQATQQGPILRGNLSQYAIAGENFRLASSLSMK